mmetsp:Transcript_36217/g.85927  ORF Transcript_36217/g.85927 Transcript_36217/m.85927 type:complete len:226 (-) Transcript_36217:1379-2056(-)
MFCNCEGYIKRNWSLLSSLVKRFLEKSLRLEKRSHSFLRGVLLLQCVLQAHLLKSASRRLVLASCYLGELTCERPQQFQLRLEQRTWLLLNEQSFGLARSFSFSVQVAVLAWPQCKLPSYWEPESLPLLVGARKARQSSSSGRTTGSTLRLKESTCSSRSRRQHPRELTCYSTQLEGKRLTNQFGMSISSSIHRHATPRTSPQLTKKCFDYVVPKGVCAGEHRFF